MNKYTKSTPDLDDKQQHAYLGVPTVLLANLFVRRVLKINA